jgi:hypothetical protein
MNYGNMGENTLPDQMTPSGSYRNVTRSIQRKWASGDIQVVALQQLRRCSVIQIFSKWVSQNRVTMRTATTKMIGVSDTMAL